jgi:hypothetical protein
MIPAKRRRFAFFSFLVIAFLFRLWFGLCSQFQDSDAKQIYLLGLKFYTTGSWPHFGPDVVWGEVQIPGALQALLVGGPFFALSIPEAPYVLLKPFIVRRLMSVGVVLLQASAGTAHMVCVVMALHRAVGVRSLDDYL